MSIGGFPRRSNSYTDTGIDSNALTAGTTMPTHDATYVTIDVKGISGAHSNHIVTLQISFNNTDWTDTANTITGEGSKTNVLCIAPYVRAKVTTVESAASTIDVTITIR